MQFSPHVVFTREVNESEVSTELSRKDIFSIVDSWGDRSAQELARVLNMGAVSEDSYVLLQSWAEQSQGDKRGKLAEFFDKEGYPSMSSVILSLPFQD